MKQVDFYEINRARTKWMTQEELPNVPDVQIIVVEMVNIPEDGPFDVAKSPFVLQLRAVTAVPYPFTFLAHRTEFHDQRELSTWPTAEEAREYAKTRNWTVVEE